MIVKNIEKTNGNICNLYIIEFGKILNVEEHIPEYYCLNSISFIDYDEYKSEMYKLLEDYVDNKDSYYIELYETDNVWLSNEEIEHIKEYKCLDDDSSYKNNLTKQILFNYVEETKGSI